MTKKCDHTSVGIFVWDEGKILLIERARPPYGFAIPAGHVDGDETFKRAARRELKEEVGLDTTALELIFEGRKDNSCRREGGTWHEWKLYKTEKTGDFRRSVDETKQAGWYGLSEIKNLSDRTRSRLQGEISDSDWEKNPGLEPIMYEFFKELKII